MLLGPIQYQLHSHIWMWHIQGWLVVVNGEILASSLVQSTTNRILWVLLGWIYVWHHGLRCRNSFGSNLELGSSFWHLFCPSFSLSVSSSLAWLFSRILPSHATTAGVSTSGSVTATMTTATATTSSWFEGPGFGLSWLPPLHQIQTFYQVCHQYLLWGSFCQTWFHLIVQGLCFQSHPIQHKCLAETPFSNTLPGSPS